MARFTILWACFNYYLYTTNYVYCVARFTTPCARFTINKMLSPVAQRAPSYK